MENKFIRVDEVADELGVSRPYAYKLIRQLNVRWWGSRNAPPMCVWHSMKPGAAPPRLT